jgi:hypothetical protein
LRIRDTFFYRFSERIYWWKVKTHFYRKKNSSLCQTMLSEHTFFLIIGAPRCLLLFQPFRGISSGSSETKVRLFWSFLIIKNSKTYLKSNKFCFGRLVWCSTTIYSIFEVLKKNSSGSHHRNFRLFLHVWAWIIWKINFEPIFKVLKLQSSTGSWKIFCFENIKKKCVAWPQVNFL